MPKVNGKEFPYTANGKAAAARERKKQGMSTAASASGGRSTARGGTRSLPSQASSTARANAFGKQGARKRKS